jgi:hypothetical protein
MHWCQGKRGRDAWDPRKLKGGSPAQPSPAALAGGEGCWGCVQRQPNVYAHVRGALLAVLAGTGYGSLFLGHELKRGEEVWSRLLCGLRDIQDLRSRSSPLFSFMCRDGEWMELGNGASDQMIRAREQ